MSPRSLYGEQVERISFNKVMTLLFGEQSFFKHHLSVLSLITRERSLQNIPQRLSGALLPG